MMPREIVKWNKSRVYRFDLNLYKPVALHSSIGRAACTLNQDSSRQKV